MTEIPIVISALGMIPKRDELLEIRERQGTIKIAALLRKSKWTWKSNDNKNNNSNNSNNLNNVDYETADMIPQIWIIEFLKVYKISD